MCVGRGGLRMQQQWDKEREKHRTSKQFLARAKKGIPAYQLTSVTHTSLVKSVSLIHGSFFTSFCIMVYF